MHEHNLLVILMTHLLLLQSQETMKPLLINLIWTCFNKINSSKIPSKNKWVLYLHQLLQQSHWHMSHTRIICLQVQLACITKESRPDSTINCWKPCNRWSTNNWCATYCENPPRPWARLWHYLQPSIHMKHWSPNEELYEKLLDYEMFLNHEDSKWTTLISAQVAQRNNQAP